MSDFDESCEEDDDHGILKKALDVELPEHFDPNKVPQTGEEYLHHVIYERSKCRTWVTADIDRSKFKSRQTFKIELDSTPKSVPKSMLPSIEWQTSTIEDFTNFRKFIHSKIKESTITAFDEVDFLNRVQMETPKFSEVTLYTQAAKIRMLQIISKHLEAIAIGNSFDRNLGSWLYAILALLEKPLSPSSCHTLREFAKKCLLVRSNLAEDSREDFYKPLNLFICIVTRFYDQLDLADH